MQTRLKKVLRLLFDVIIRLRQSANDWIETKGTADVARLVIVHRHPPHSSLLGYVNIEDDFTGALV